MEQFEPSHFDLIVIGTGLQESLIAGAAAKAGSSVLHLDPAGHYGSHWANMSLNDFTDWVSRLPGATPSHARGTSAPAFAEQDATQTSTDEEASTATQQQQRTADGGVGTAYFGHLSSYSRAELFVAEDAQLGNAAQYNIDLAAKVAYCSGPMITALLNAGAHNYLEFKLLQGSYLWSGTRLEPVAASRAEVFRDRSLTPADKRDLMRFLQLAQTVLEGTGSETSLGRALARRPDQPLAELLRSEGLSPRLRRLVLYAVAFADADQEPFRGQGRPDGAGGAVSAVGEPTWHATQDRAPTGAARAAPGAVAPPAQPAASSTRGRASPAVAEGGASSSGQRGGAIGAGIVTLREGLEAMRLYMRSVGRYGGTGMFLAPMYGCGELPQAFCRVAAVAGAVYALRTPVLRLLVEDGLCRGVTTASGQVLTCGALAVHADFLREMLPCSAAESEQQRAVSRAVCIMDGPLQEGEHQLLVVMPPGSVFGSNPFAIRALQVGHATCVAPPDRYLLHLSTPCSSASPTDDLRPALASLVQLPAGSSPPCPQPQPAADPYGLADPRPRALLAAYWRQSLGQPPGDLPDNVACCGPPDGSPDYRSAVAGAEAGFQQLFPGQELFAAEAGLGAEGDESDEEGVQALERALHRMGLANGVTDGAAPADSGGGVQAGPS